MPYSVAQESVVVSAGRVLLHGILGRPPASAGRPAGVVLFAHGSGSSRFSRRNAFVAEQLQAAGLRTLLVDLLTEEESQDRHNVFDIGLLGARVRACVEWLSRTPSTRGLPIGLFGASTGAAAALVAAAETPALVGAVVSRGGRPDLALPVLPDVQAPTLLIVGGDDEPVVGMNREAFARLTCPKRLDIVPGATHLFEEPGALEHVAELARDWFLAHLHRPAQA